jgi:predicted P-loop ATPase/GTPase
VPKPFPSSLETDAMVARVAPSILALLADGAPRSKRAVAAALAGKHPKDEVVRTLMRLAVTGRVAEKGGKYRALAPEGTGGA